jgi:hypothetical protein
MAQRKQIEHAARDTLQLLLERLDDALHSADRSLESLTRETAT